MSSNQVPIYSQVLPKSKDGQHGGRPARQVPPHQQQISPHSPRVFSSLRYDPRTPQPGVTDPNFDPLNHNHGGNFGGFANQSVEAYSRVEKFARESARRSARELGAGRAEQGGGRQGRRDRQATHVRQAEHRINLRSLSLNENAAARANTFDRTPTEFVGLVNPYREAPRDYIPKDAPPTYRERETVGREAFESIREHLHKENSKNSLSTCHEAAHTREVKISNRDGSGCPKDSGRIAIREISSHSLSAREQTKSSSRETSKLTRENLRDFAAGRDTIYENEGGLRGCLQAEVLVPDAGNRVHSMKKSNSANKIGSVASGEKRKFYCREWAFQKLAHCLEQRPVSKTCGALILGDAGSGKTALCKELSQPGSGPSARQQRALQRRMLARHFLQGQNETSLTMGEFIRTLVMQILNNSSEHRKSTLRDTSSSTKEATIPEEEKVEASAPSAPPLDPAEERSRRARGTMERIHEREQYDDMLADIVEERLKVSLSIEEEKKPPGRVTNTNPFLPNFQSPGEREQKLYENHENVFLRNLSQQPKDARNSRLFRQQSEPPLMDKKSAVLQKSLSTDSKNVQEIRPRRNSTESEVDLKNYDSLKNMEDAKLSSASKSLFKEILEADVDRRKEVQERKNSDSFDTKDLKTPLSPGGSNVHMAAVKVSRIPVASFKYPNMSVLSSAENSPSKSRIHRESERNSASDNSDNKESSKGSAKQTATLSEAKKSEENDEQKPTVEDELPEYQNILKPPSCPKELSPKIGRIEDFNLGDYRNIGETILNSPDFDPAFNIQKLTLGEKNLTAISPMKNTAQHDDVPPPIPSLPVNPRTLIANCYYEKLLSEPEIQQALLPQNLEKNPDDCFKKAILFPLLEIDPPKQCLFLLVDSIDETPLTGASMTSSTLTKDREKNGSDSGNLAVKSTNSSKTIAELLANHHHLFPQWLLLVCTARKQSKYLTKMFTGFRKISLDDLRRGHVTLDVQRYILGRLDSEPRLGQHVSRDAAQALDHLRIKSNGCFLYLERVLDGLADGSVALREIREIPGTLNGLYMWLCQRLFHGRKFAKVQPLLNVLLVAKCGVDSEILYRCLLTTNHTITREDFNKRLHLLRRILTLDPRTGVLSIFHHSFSEWLLDVKHCTRRFLCSEARGHAALTMYYTLHARSLNAGDVHRMVLHATRLEHHLNRDSKSSMESSLGPQMERSILVPGLDLHTLILLWILDSGCDVRASLKVQQQRQAVVPEDTPIATIPEFLSGLDCPTLPRDCRVLRALLEMGAQLEPPQPPTQPDIGDSQIEEANTLQISLEQLLMLEAEEEEDEECGDALHCLELFTMDQSLGRAPVHTLAQNGEADSMALALQAYVSAGGLLTVDLVDTVDRAGHTALQLAARAGRAAAAGALLQAGAAASLPDPEGWTPLRAAAWAGHTQVVELLLNHGCEVDCVDSDHRTALRAAAWSGHEEIVRLLIAHGADVNKTDLEGRTALIAAAYMGHTDIVTHLLDHGADIDHADADGRTALAVAALCSAGGGGAGGGGCAQLLLERGAAPARPDKDGMTPLLVAAFEGHKEVIELLLEAEADPEAADRAGRTPLWAAAAAGHAPAVRALLFWGCCVDTIDRDGRTVLSVAAAQGNVEVVRQLVDRGLDEHHRDNAGWTPLHYAAFEGHLEVCDVLLEAGAKVDEKDNDGKGPLMLAAQEGHCRLMELLIDEWGAPVDQHAHDGKTALRVAALEGHYEAVRILVDRGAAIDALDADQRSTLYILALDNRISMARYLIQRAEANVETRDSEGRTPLHVSAWQGHYEMVNLLLTVGECNMDARDGERRTPLHSASWRGQAAVVRLLLSKGADPNAECDQGATPLGIASQEGHEECVLWLLQHGANPKHSDHCGRTPAKVALRAGHLHVCRLLERWGATPAIQSVPSLQPELAGTNTSGSTAETKPCTASLSNARLSPIPLSGHNQGSPDSKRRSVHSSNSTKSSSNLTSSTVSSSHREAVPPPPPPHSRALPPSDVTTEPPGNRSGLALTFAQQVARCGRRGGGAPASPLYATPPHSPLSDVCSPTQPQLSILSSIAQQFTSSPGGQPNASSNATDRHFCRDTHMRIILGRENKHSPPTAGEHRDSGGRVGASNAVQSSRITCRKIVGSIGRIARRKKASSPIVGGSKSKRNGIVTNPAMRLVANVRNGLDTAAANIRRTGVALAASASSNNPAVKTNAFQWRRETPL